ncbi:MAG TPA: hypothetical protein VFQ16_01775 [Burkholderiaceae bacterium]|nr:hypothetical protein [Burkholderiaceae bacterium]
MRRSRTVFPLSVAAALLAACDTTPPAPPTGPMGFFVTSVGLGDGGNLGGLAGADAHCQKLAAAAGAGHRTWRAYLSTSFAPNKPPVHARDRIGKGPWFNAKGVQIARDVGHLHNGNNISKNTALTEKGQLVNGRGDTPTMHDILTGSRVDGTAYGVFPGQPDQTCRDWTSNSTGSAMLGHHDRNSPDPDSPWGKSWNSSHNSRGCTPDDLKSSGGAGLFYCFAAD